MSMLADVREEFDQLIERLKHRMDAREFEMARDILQKLAKIEQERIGGA